LGTVQASRSSSSSSCSSSSHYKLPRLEYVHKASGTFLCTHCKLAALAGTALLMELPFIRFLVLCLGIDLLEQGLHWALAV
jgi:hypothetical protein